MSSKRPSSECLKAGATSQTIPNPSEEQTDAAENQSEALVGFFRDDGRAIGLSSSQVLDSVPLQQGRGVNGSQWRRNCTQLRALYQKAKVQALAKTEAERGALPSASEEDRNRWHARCSKLVKRYYEPLLEHAYVTQLSRTSKLWKMNQQLTVKYDEDQKQKKQQENNYNGKNCITPCQQCDLFCTTKDNEENLIDQGPAQQRFSTVPANLGHAYHYHPMEPTQMMLSSQHGQSSFLQCRPETQTSTQLGLFQLSQPLHYECGFPDLTHCPAELPNIPLETEAPVEFQLFSPNLVDKPQEIVLSEIVQSTGGVQRVSDSLGSQLDALLDLDTPDLLSSQMLQYETLDNEIIGWFDQDLAPAVSAALEPSLHISNNVNEFDDQTEVPRFRSPSSGVGEAVRSSSSASSLHRNRDKLL